MLTAKILFILFLQADPPPPPPEAPPPADPANLIQSNRAGGDPQPVGFEDDDGIVAVRGTVFHSLGAAVTVQLEVEIKPTAAPFSETGVMTGNPVPGSGGSSEVVATGLADGSYHWRGRTVDSAGKRSNWVEFDPQPTPDFVVDTALTPPPQDPTPDPPTNLIQASSPGGIPRAVGFVDDDPQMAFRGTVSSSVSAVQIQVEIKPNDVGFDGGGIFTGPLVSGTGESEVVAALANGSYHWRARTLSITGQTSAWVEFDPSSLVDFGIATPATPPPTPPPDGGDGDDVIQDQDVVVADDDDDDDDLCGLMGVEVLLVLGLLTLIRVLRGWRPT